MNLLLEGRNDRAPGLFYRCNGRARSSRDLEIQLGFELALGQKPHPVASAPDHSGLAQDQIGDRRVRLQASGIERALNAPQIDDGEVIGEVIVKSALGYPHIERHLTALEAVDRDAGARLGALDAASRGFAE